MENTLGVLFTCFKVQEVIWNVAETRHILIAIETRGKDAWLINKPPLVAQNLTNNSQYIRCQLATKRRGYATGRGRSSHAIRSLISEPRSLELISGWWAESIPVRILSYFVGRVRVLSSFVNKTCEQSRSLNNYMLLANNLGFQSSIIF